MARQFVCKSDGRSTIKNSGLRKFDPVRAFLKVSRELLSFFSLSFSLVFLRSNDDDISSDPFFFSSFFSNVTKFVYLILIEKKRRIFERNIVAR